MPDVTQGKLTDLSTWVQPKGVTLSLRHAGNSIPGATAWFGPMQPLQPIAPESFVPREWDYPTGANINYTPRGSERIGFAALRALADNCDVLRLVIESRKDQFDAMKWVIRPRVDRVTGKPMTGDKQNERIQLLYTMLDRPDRRQTYQQWQRSLLEDLLVIDAPALWRWRKRGGQLFSLEPISGDTIFPLMDVSGRTPIAPDPAYQQIIHGIVAENFTSDELLYMPRNVSTNRVYGYSPVEQIIITVNIAIRRALSQLDYYTDGSVPDAVVGLPKEYSVDQIATFQKYFDGMLSGNSAARRRLRAVPGDFKFQELKSAPLKDDFDEWLTRVICYALNIPPEPFVKQTNKSVVETQKDRATEEGIVPLQNWWRRSVMNPIVTQEDLGLGPSPDLEFAFEEEDDVDQKTQMEVSTGYASKGIITINAVREQLGEEPYEDEIYSKPMVLTATGWVPADPAARQEMEMTAASHAATIAQDNAAHQASLNPLPAAQADAIQNPQVDPNKQAQLEDDQKAREQAAEQAKENAKTQAANDAKAKLGKGVEDEPRDANGKWTSGGGETHSWVARSSGIIDLLPAGSNFMSGKQVAWVRSSGKGKYQWTGSVAGGKSTGPHETNSKVSAQRAAESWVAENYPEIKLGKSTEAQKLAKDARSAQVAALSLGRPSATAATRSLRAKLSSGLKAAAPRIADQVRAALAVTKDGVEPSAAQAAAGNYKKGHVRLHGLDISIETPAGAVRRGVGADGKPWEVTMSHPYGYLRGTLGADASQVDVYIGPSPKVPLAFVVDQHAPKGGAFDEHKVVVGAKDAAEAVDVYDAGFSDGSGPERRHGVTQLSVAALKAWLKGGGGTSELAKVLAKADEKSEDDRAQEIVDALDLSSLEILVRGAEDELRAVALDAAKKAVAGIKLADTDLHDMFAQVNERAVKWAVQHAATLVSEIDQATRDELRDVIAVGLDANLGLDAIVELVSQSGAFSDDRAELIARTEIGNANSNGALEGLYAAKDAGVKLQKTWTITDADTCDICVSNQDAGPIDLDEQFPSGDQAPLAHPHCRCVLTSVTSQGDEA